MEYTQAASDYDDRPGYDSDDGLEVCYGGSVQSKHVGGWRDDIGNFQEPLDSNPVQHVIRSKRPFERATSKVCLGPFDCMPCSRSFHQWSFFGLFMPSVLRKFRLNPTLVYS